MPRFRLPPSSRGTSPWGWGALAAALVTLGLAAEAGGAGAGEKPSAGRLRVGTSGDYAPFSLAAEDGARSGFDVEVARRYAKERGLEVEIVRFRWPELLRDLEADRFEVAMSGVTVVPRRSLAGRFSVPVVESGAVLLTREPERWKTPDELDRPDQMESSPGLEMPHDQRDAHRGGIAGVDQPNIRVRRKREPQRRV